MKNKFIAIISILIVIFPLNIFAVDLDINSNNAILYNLNDNSILYEKNSNEKVSIASLTKIMTAVVALENIDNLDDKVKLTYKDFIGLAEANASVAGFKIGDEVTYKDLLYGLMLPSGADAALALCNNIANGVDEYVELMNNKAKELGLSSTHFVTPTGLDAEGAYSTVNDVSKLFNYALNNPTFKEIITTMNYTTTNGLKLKSTVKRALDYYALEMPYLLGGKTGTTDDAGLCLASISTKDDVDYMLVTVKAPYSKTNPYNYLDAKTIYEYFMNNYGYKKIVEKGDVLVTIDTKYAKNDNVKIKADKSIEKYLENTFDKEKVKYKYTGIDIITTKMDKGTKLGKIDVYYEGKVLDTIEIKLPEKQKFSLGKYLINNKWIFIVLIIILLLLLKIKVNKKNNHKNKSVKYNVHKYNKLNNTISNR